MTTQRKPATFLPTTFGKRLSLEEALEGAKVVNVLPMDRMPLVYIPATATIQQGLSILSMNGITSAPVYDPTLDWFYGFFELFDVLSYLLKIFVGKLPENIVTEQQWRSYAGDMGMLNFKGTNFGNHNILDLMGTQTRTQVVPINSSVPHLLKRLANEHRVLVDSGALATFSIVTQLDMIRFLATNVNLFRRDQMRTTLDTLGLAKTKWVYSIEAHTLAIAAFHKMWSFGVSSIAVVGSEGELLGNLSITDLKNLRQDNFPSLIEPVGSFIMNQVWSPKLPPISVQKGTTFENCLLLFAACKIHHVWVTNERNEPTGVISAGDILKELNKMQEKFEVVA